MNYNIKGTDLEVTPPVQVYLDKKLTHLEKFLQGETVSVLDVELAYDSGAAAKKSRATFNIVVGTKTMHASASGDSIQEAIDLAVAELMREATRKKSKRLHIFRRSAAHVKDFFRGLRSRP